MRTLANSTRHLGGFAETAIGNTLSEIAVGSGDQLKLAHGLAVGSDGKESFALDGTQGHGLLVEPKLADLVEKHHRSVGSGQKAEPVWRRWMLDRGWTEGAGERELRTTSRPAEFYRLKPDRAG